MKTKIRARKRTVIRWIEEKFGSLEMLANVAGVDTSQPAVRQLLDQVKTSREPVVLGIRWRNALIEVHIEHHAVASIAAPSELPSNGEGSDSRD